MRHFPLKRFSVAVAASQRPFCVARRLRRAVTPNACAFAARRFGCLHVGLIFDPRGKLRPPLAEQKLCDVAVLDRANSLWWLADMFEAAGNGFSIQQGSYCDESARPTAPSRTRWRDADSIPRNQHGAIELQGVAISAQRATEINMCPLEVDVVRLEKDRRRAQPVHANIRWSCGPSSRGRIFGLLH